MKQNLILLLVLLILGSLVFLQSRSMSKEQGDTILAELQSIKKELNQIKQKGLAQQGRGKPANLKTAQVSTLGNPILGDLKAPVTLVEFTDYQCPYCQNFYSKAYKKLKTQYIDTGKLRLVLRDLPLPKHLYAKTAAISTHCAGEQDKFWQMHDALFEAKGKINQAEILGYAKSIGLDTSSFKSCLTSGRHDKDIEQDVIEAKLAGIRGTPSFVLGRTTDNLVDGTLLRGTRPFVTFKDEIESLLK
jgi:protein-disulfide isomerase